MSCRIAFILAGFVLGATPAFAQSTCAEPVTPATIDGATITQPQLVAAIAAAKDFIAKSDAFQQCMADDLNAQKASAVKNQTGFDPAVQQTIMGRIDANQKAKEKVGTDINGAITTYKKAHAQ